MIEAIVIAYLADALPCTVYGTVPANPPETFVVVEKTGGSRVNRLDGATLAVQSYAPSIAQAAALNLQVKAAMEAIVSLDSVSSCDLDTDYNYTDTTRDRPRYQAVFDVVYYEED